MDTHLEKKKTYETFDLMSSAAINQIRGHTTLTFVRVLT